MSDKLQSAKDMTVRKFMLKKFPTSKYIDCPIPKHHWETIQEYADAYAAQCLKDERERIKNELPLEITSSEFNDEYEDLMAKHGSDYAGGWSDGMQSQFERLRSEFIELIERGEG